MKTASLTISKRSRGGHIYICVKDNRKEIARLEVDKNDFVDAIFGLAEVPAELLKNR